VTDFLRLVIAGTSLGFQYALIVLGFVVIYRATGVLNFAQGGLVLLGGYVAYNAHVTWGLPFPLAVVVAMAVGAVIGALVEVLLLRRLEGQPIFAVILVTLGVLTIIEEAVISVWGAGDHDLGDPWGIRSVRAGEVLVELRSIWTILIAGAALVVTFAIFRWTRTGLAMRGTALDLEAAVVQGVPVRRVVALSWALAGAVAALAGVMAGSGPANVTPSLGAIALVAFPAMILGGLESPGGAVVGGLVIGITQTLTAGYQHSTLSFLGDGFYTVMPYIVMIAILSVRPYGLFGVREVRRA
jgi:branched-chain amino acid transport system permease protein